MPDDRKYLPQEFPENREFEFIRIRIMAGASLPALQSGWNDRHPALLSKKVDSTPQVTIGRDRLKIEHAINHESGDRRRRGPSGNLEIATCGFYSKLKDSSVLASSSFGDGSGSPC